MVTFEALFQRTYRSAGIGVFGCGCWFYWDQFPATGNTNTRCRFPPDVGTFVEQWSMEGPTHHFALGVGHIAHLVEGFCRCWGIECVDVADLGYRRPQTIW